MTLKGKQLLITFIILFSIGALVLMWQTSISNASHFKIATTSQHAGHFKNLPVLGKQYGIEVSIDVYDTSREILQAFYAGEADAFSLDAYTYISTYHRLNLSKAILGLPSKYYFITPKESVLPARANIGVYDTLFATYIIGDPTLNLLAYDDERQMTAALEEGLLDGLFIPENLYDDTQHSLVIQSDYRGYYEDLLIVTEDWISDPSTDAYEFTNALLRGLSENLSPPDEESLMSIMTRLFTDVQISTRYYYEDLVWTPDP